DRHHRRHPRGSLAGGARSASACWDEAGLIVRPAVLMRRWRHLPREVQVGGIGVTMIVLLAVLAPLWWPYDPNRIDILPSFEPPSLAHPFGTDAAGRDLLARVLYGLQLDLGIVSLLTAICFVSGSVIGAYAGFRGGWVDVAISRISDTV